MTGDKLKIAALTSRECSDKLSNLPLESVLPSNSIYFSEYGYLGLTGLSGGQREPVWVQVL